MEHPNAFKIANFLIKLGEESKDELTPLKLMKLVYICHGYILAITGSSALSPRFDKVEAWKYGPVIPSVYHSFKSYQNSPVTEPTVILKECENGRFSSEIPQFSDNNEEELLYMRICKFVYRQYAHLTASELIEMLHRQGTPWASVYEEGKNNEISDDLTKRYYKALLDNILSIKKL